MNYLDVKHCYQEVDMLKSQVQLRNQRIFIIVAALPLL